MSQSRPLTSATKLKMIFDSLKSQKELDSGALSHKCRLQGETGLGPATSFLILGHSLNLPISSLLVLSMVSIKKLYGHTMDYHGIIYINVTKEFLFS
jgi:hypothetical protein